ncbi:AAEL010687-PA [Aedes aegypti]|uniref:AAEL010687-PA n=1 Tax=Aedes aegypti TaxID=7159 RepID=Q16S66_AEDAE|nr:AAEL010687-PA [Aedes aegypti]
MAAVDKKGRIALVHILARQVSWDIFKYLLDHCIQSDVRDANGVHIFNMQDQEGKTLLYHAVSYGRLRIVEFLLDHKVDPTVRDYCGRFPLYNAVLLRHSAIVYALVKQRPDTINLQYCVTGDTPFSVAATLNNVELVRLFLNNGADLGLKDEAGCTVIAKTIIKESCAALQVILNYANQRGIEVVNNVTGNGWNALQCALMKDNVEIFRVVIEHMIVVGDVFRCLDVDNADENFSSQNNICWIGCWSDIVPRMAFSATMNFSDTIVDEYFPLA